MAIGVTSTDFLGVFFLLYQRSGSMSYLDLIKKKITNPVGSDFLFLSLDAWVTQFEGEIPFQEIVDVMRDYVEISDDYGLTK